MATCSKLAEGEVVRITRVDDCGAPVEGADNAFVDDCWASVAMNPNVESGTDIDFRAMNGRSCGFKRGRPSFRGFDITGQFFTASPEMIELLTGDPVYLDWEGNPIGWDDCSVQARSGFALEVWQNVVGEECPDEGDAIFWYWLLPWISNAVLGNLTVDDAGVTFELTGNSRADGRWSLGPWDIQTQDADGTAGPMLEPLGSNCHRRSFLTSIAPPDAACAYVTVPPNNVAS